MCVLRVVYLHRLFILFCRGVYAEERYQVSSAGHMVSSEIQYREESEYGPHKPSQGRSFTPLQISGISIDSYESFL